MMQGLLPRKLRMLRAERGLTLRQVAALTGVAKETLSDLERGRRRPHDVTLAKLAEGYGVPLEELIDLEGSPVESVHTGKALAPH
jgi:transcriptional regulator with XRE-family HTH domain